MIAAPPNALHGDLAAPELYSCWALHDLLLFRRSLAVSRPASEPLNAVLKVCKGLLAKGVHSNLQTLLLGTIYVDDSWG